MRKILYSATVSASQSDNRIGPAHGSAAAFSSYFNSPRTKSEASSGKLNNLPAAFLVGNLWGHGWNKKVWIVPAMMAGSAVLYVPSLLRLSLLVPNDEVFGHGLYPFIAGDVVELYIASLVVPIAWTALDRRQGGGIWT